MPRTSAQRKLSRWEVLGAWLRLWTPPRDVEVPPVPWRAVAAGAAVLVAAAVVFVVVGLPAIRDDNRDAADRDRADRDRTRAAIRARQQAEQAPRRARGRPARDVAARRALVADLEAAVGADARARVRSGKLSGTIRRVDCVPGPRSRQSGAPEDDLRRARGGYDCTAVTSDIEGTRGSVGYPFKAVVDFSTGGLTWCKVNPPPGERTIIDPRRTLELPRVCADPA